MSHPRSPAPTSPGTTTALAEGGRLTPWHWGALALSLVPLWVYAATSQRLGDLSLYARVVHAFLGGAVPNVDFRFEYPPYALLWFVPAGWLGADAQSFAQHFSLQLTLLDAAIKWALLTEGARWGRSVRAWGPFALYTLAGWLQVIHLLRRYDLIPAALTVFALVALARRREGLAGAALAVGVVTKLYPVVLVPLALAVCWRAGSLRRLVLGGLAGLAPLIPVSALWPWWRFASFHVERGLQVESLGASLLWAAHHLGLASPEWVLAPAAYELHGPAAEAILSLSRGAWVAGTGVAVVLGLRAVWRRPELDAASLARVALAPLVAFVALNPVLSPQYLIWLTGVAALAFHAGSGRVPLALFAAAVLSRLLFSGTSYYTGLAPGLTLLLVVRNGLLLWACVELLWELWRGRAPAVDAGAASGGQAAALTA
ncbi:glycosyltransferase 87 family protein [Myxococcaceae bacterium GXIMD 01537]